MRRRYASNTGLLILNKWLLSSYGFRRPVFLTLCHMLACSAAGYGVSAGGLVPSQPVRSPEQFRKIAALAVRVLPVRGAGQRGAALYPRVLQPGAPPPPSPRYPFFPGLPPHPPNHPLRAVRLDPTQAASACVLEQWR